MSSIACTKPEHNDTITIGPEMMFDLTGTLTNDGKSPIFGPRQITGKATCNPGGHMVPVLNYDDGEHEFCLRVGSSESLIPNTTKTIDMEIDHPDTTVGAKHPKIKMTVKIVWETAKDKKKEDKDKKQYAAPTITFKNLTEGQTDAGLGTGIFFAHIKVDPTVGAVWDSFTAVCPHSPNEITWALANNAPGDFKNYKVTDASGGPIQTQDRNVWLTLTAVAHIGSDYPTKIIQVKAN